MLPAYTFALGGTEAVKKIVSFVEMQQSVRQTILDKQNNVKNFAVGDDSTFDYERDILNTQKGGE